MPLLAFLEDSQVLDSLLTERVGSRFIVFISLLQRLPVVCLADLPGQPGSKLEIRGVHAHENFLQVAHLVFTCLLPEQQAEAREVLWALANQKLGFHAI